MTRVQDQAPPLTDELEVWIRDNGREQDKRYARIVAAMEALGEERDAWIDAFLLRLQSRGFNYDGDRLRRIAAEELPRKPAGPLKVVY